MRPACRFGRPVEGRGQTRPQAASRARHSLDVGRFPAGRFRWWAAKSFRGRNRPNSSIQRWRLHSSLPRFDASVRPNDAITVAQVSERFVFSTRRRPRTRVRLKSLQYLRHPCPADSQRAVPLTTSRYCSTIWACGCRPGSGKGGPEENPILKVVEKTGGLPLAIKDLRRQLGRLGQRKQFRQFVKRREFEQKALLGHRRLRNLATSLSCGHCDDLS